MNGKVVSGIETVMAHSGLEGELKSADWVITGEGAFDHQSLYGKVVSGIAKMASQGKCRLGVIAGSINVPQQEYEKIGIVGAVGCKTNDMTLDYAIENSRELLSFAAQRFAEEYLL